MDERPDLCPMCQGTGSCTLEPPRGAYYVRIRREGRFVYAGDQSIELTPQTAHTETEKLVNEYARTGYELFQYELASACEVWVMRWRWR